MIKHLTMAACTLLLIEPIHAQVICCQLTNTRPQHRVHSSVPAACNTAIQNGAVLWNNSGANISITYVGTYPAKVGRSVGNVVSHETGSMSGVVAADAAAYVERRFTSYDYARGRWNFDSFNVIYNENYTPSRFYCGPVGGIADSQLDFQDIATHEIGHGLGLDHDAFSTANIMYPGNPWGISRRRLSARDVRGAEILFGTR